MVNALFESPEHSDRKDPTVRVKVIRSVRPHRAIRIVIVGWRSRWASVSGSGKGGEPTARITPIQSNFGEAARIADSKVP